MAAHRTFTEADLESAQQRLASLPDLRRNKISQADFIESLKDQIISLSKEKGYDTSEIKAVLNDLGVKVTSKDVAALISPQRKPRSTRSPAKAGSEIAPPVAQP